jgi:hypothetical protein
MRERYSPRIAWFFGLILISVEMKLRPLLLSIGLATVAGGLMYSVLKFADSDASHVGDAPSQTPDPGTATDASIVPKEPMWRQLLIAYQADKSELFGPSGEDRMNELQGFVESLEVKEVQRAIGDLQQLQAKIPTTAGRDLLMRVLQRWVEIDIRLAANWVSKLPDGIDRQGAIGVVARSWARKDLREAIAWSGKLASEAERDNAQVTAMDEVVHASPSDVLKLAGNLPPSGERDDLIVRASGIWAADVPDQALAWARELSDPSLREQVLSEVVTIMAERNPVSAGQLAVDSLSPGQLQERTVIAILQRWASWDEAAAKAWAKEFPEGELKTKALETVEITGKRNRKEILY